MGTWRTVEPCPVCDGTGKVYPDNPPALPTLADVVRELDEMADNMARSAVTVQSCCEYWPNQLRELAARMQAKGGKG